MSRLLDVAQVERGNGRWTAGLEVEYLQCALTSGLAALCLPGPANHLSGEGGTGPSGDEVNIFGVVTRLRQPNACRTADPEAAVRDAVDTEIEKALGFAIWYGGTSEASVWFGNSSVTLITGATSVGAMLRRWYSKTVGIEPIIHLGLEAAEDLATSFSESGRLLAFPDVPVVINPSYPAAGVAITGPIDVRISGVETIQTHSLVDNREQTEANVIVGVSFDPCAVVLSAAAYPDQVYIERSPTSDRTITVYVVGTSTSTAVAWGDGDPDGSIAASPTDPGSASHTYDTSGTYDVTVTSEGGTAAYTVTV